MIGRVLRSSAQKSSPVESGPVVQDAVNVVALGGGYRPRMRVASIYTIT
jgi:hypothetical protein